MKGVKLLILILVLAGITILAPIGLHEYTIAHSTHDKDQFIDTVRRTAPINTEFWVCVYEEAINDMGDEIYSMGYRLYDPETVLPNKYRVKLVVWAEDC